MPTLKKQLTQKELKRQLHYDPETGIFIWKVVNSNRIKVGDVAGCIEKNTGYVYIGINGLRYSGHRLAWLYVYGYFPENIVDHINQNTTSNWIKNLREVGRRCNFLNSKSFRINSSGVTGVYRDKRRNKWYSQVTVNQKTINLGTFKSFKDAVLVRWKAEKKYNFPACQSYSKAYKYLLGNGDI